VIGLTSALLLAKENRYAVTVIAEFMPGDYDIRYASPWAGADYLPVSFPDTAFNTYERETWTELESLAKGLPEAGVHFLESTKYRWNEKNTSTAVS
jgi:D-amino-acid oxidase